MNAISGQHFYTYFSLSLNVAAVWFLAFIEILPSSSHWNHNKVIDILAIQISQHENHSQNDDVFNTPWMLSHLVAFEKCTVCRALQRTAATTHIEHSHQTGFYYYFLLSSNAIAVSLLTWKNVKFPVNLTTHARAATNNIDNTINCKMKKKKKKAKSICWSLLWSCRILASTGIADICRIQRMTQIEPIKSQITSRSRRNAYETLLLAAVRMSLFVC